MSCLPRLLALCLLPSLALARPAPPAELRVLVDTSTDMPMADIRDEQLRGGLHYDLGRLLAAELGRQARFLVLPRKRLAAALTTGQADLMCHYQPAWLNGPYRWSHPFLPDAELLISRRDAPPLRSLGDLAGQRIGTVLGFRYPSLENLLGEAMLRDDAPSAAANLRKLAAGRVRHAVVGQRFLDYQRRIGAFSIALQSSRILSRIDAGCALSPRSRLSIQALNQAISRLQARGQIEAMYAPYR